MKEKEEFTEISVDPELAVAAAAAAAEEPLRVAKALVMTGQPRAMEIVVVDEEPNS
jgi:hypothetical protein